MNSGIYIIHSTATDKIYVGLSRRLSNRKWEHWNNVNSNKHLQNAMAKYGKDTFEFMVVHECEPDKLLGAEAAYADYYKASGYELFNSAKCGIQMGSVGNRERREEHNRKIGDANRGKVRTAEMRKHTGDTQRGRREDPEHAHARTRCLVGSQRTEEQKQLMREKCALRNADPVYQQKLKDGLALRDAKRKASKAAV